MQRIPETGDKWRREILEKPWAQWHYLILFSNVKDVIKTVLPFALFNASSFSLLVERSEISNFIIDFQPFSS